MICYTLKATRGSCGGSKEPFKAPESYILPLFVTHSFTVPLNNSICVEEIVPLLKTSPTDYGTLSTALQLTHGISATVVGAQRKTLITTDCNRKLKIQQSVDNTNWILRAGALSPHNICCPTCSW